MKKNTEVQSTTANNNSVGADTKRTKGRAFPFTTIIVTNPDEKSAKSAQTLLDSTLKRYLYKNDVCHKGVKIISTCDPFGARCGSFGGTLAALELIKYDDNKHACKDDKKTTNGVGNNVNHRDSETVLCLHAGGDSSRCPLSMILGKAWTNLPSTDFRNPITWLIFQLEDLFYKARIPKGSLLVTATDCLISLGQEQLQLHQNVGDGKNDPIQGACGDADYDATTHSDPESLDPFTVLGVAVPAPLNTAKNHGVYVMPESALSKHNETEEKGETSSATASSNSTLKIETPFDVWQKPSVDQLLASPSISSPLLQNNPPSSVCFDVPHRSGKQAWIDVGIVVFYPKAFQILKNLSEGLLSMSTRKGLEAAYHNESPTSESLESFAKKKALKVDLYTDILHNLPLGSRNNESISFDDAASAAATQKPEDSDIHSALKKILSVLPLKVLLAPEGSFLHLGTTQELIQFITTTTTTTTTTSFGSDDGCAVSNLNKASTRAIPPMMHQDVAQNLARALRLNHRFETFPEPGTEKDFNDAKTELSPSHQHRQNNTTFCSTFPSNTENTQLGSSTFVEYSDLESYESVTIGDNCMLSGWRRKDPSHDDSQENRSVGGSVTEETNLYIPDCISVQLLPLVSAVAEGDNKFDRCRNEKDRWVMMVLGTTDPIKTSILKSEIYGVPFLDFINRTGITGNQLGFVDEFAEHDCLWTAKIHPVVSTDNESSSISFSSLFGWVEKLRTNDPNISSNDSFSDWLSADRVSLRDIHGISNASKEWTFRLALEKKIRKLNCKNHIQNIVTIIKNRCQSVSCDLRWLKEMDCSNDAFETFSILVDKLGELAIEEYANNNYDVSGRAFMLASAMIADLPSEFFPDSSTDGEMHNASNHRFMKLIDSWKSSPPFPTVEEEFRFMKSWMWNDTGNSMSLCSEVLERLALRIVEHAITDGFRKYQVDPADDPTAKIKMKRNKEPIRDKYVLSVAPVRVDLAGGWSDTPPISYEYGGSVTGMAVLVDGQNPLSCRCRLVTGGTGILLKTELRELSTGSLLSSRQEEVTNHSDLSDFRDPSARCALLKAALVCLGMVSEEEICLYSSDDIEEEENCQSSTDIIQNRINLFCCSSDHGDNVRIEIITTSLLGMGTGMGTSSILGACILQSLAECVGIGKLSDECLIQAVLVLEQLLSSGGGWQDQAHGIVPGLKTVTSAPEIPLTIKIDPIALSEEDSSALEKRLLFAYTGKTRLAKNILRKVLRRWARRTNEIVDVVEGLVSCSSAVRTALSTRSWDSLGEHLHQAHNLKCAMAGEGSCAEPESVKLFVSEMMDHGQIKGAMLCGAGGGGFLLLLLSQDADRNSVESLFETSIRPKSKDFEDFSFHDCKIAKSGLTTSVLHDESPSMNSDTYKLLWQQQTMS